MLRYVGNQIADFLDEVDYYGKRSLAYIAGKAGLEAGKIGLENSGVLAALPFAGTTLGKNAGMLAAAPLSIGLSAYFVQRDHRHRIDRMTNQYREEIASWLGMHPEKVTESDMLLAARGDAARGIPGNPALKETLEESIVTRNWNFGISAASTAVTAAVAYGFKDNLKHWVKDELLSGTSLSGGPLETGLVALAMGAVGFGIYMGIKTVGHWVADRIFGEDGVTVDDRVREVRRTLELGRAVSQEKVLLTYLEAHPERDQAIKQRYGKRFAKLDAEHKREIILDIGPSIGLQPMTQALNLGMKKPEELMWWVSGQESGVSPKIPNDEHTHQGYLSRAWKGCVEKVRNAIGTPEKESVEKTPKHEVSPTMADFAADYSAMMEEMFGPDARAREKSAAPSAVRVHAESPDGNERIDAFAYAEDRPERKISFRQVVQASRGGQGGHSYKEILQKRERRGAESFSERLDSQGAEVQLG